MNKGQEKEESSDTILLLHLTRIAHQLSWLPLNAVVLCTDTSVEFTPYLPIHYRTRERPTRVPYYRTQEHPTLVQNTGHSISGKFSPFYCHEETPRPKQLS